MRKSDDFQDDPAWTRWRGVKLAARKLRDWYCSDVMLMEVLALNAAVWAYVLLRDICG